MRDSHGVTHQIAGTAGTAGRIAGEENPWNLVDKELPKVRQMR